jgi:hypothetical protein
MFSSNKIVIVLAIVIIIILITNSNVSKKEPYYEQANNMISIEPVYIEMELYGYGGDTKNIMLTFRNGNISKKSDLIWNVNGTYTISPNSYIYIGGENLQNLYPSLQNLYIEEVPSLPNPYKLNPSISNIHYELRDKNGNVIPSTYDEYNWVKIFVKDGQYVIQPTISGDEIYKTGQVGSWSYKIMAIPTAFNISQQHIQPSPTRKRPIPPCPSGWYQSDNQCLQICSNNNQLRNPDGTCICKKGGYNQSCHPEFLCFFNNSCIKRTEHYYASITLKLDFNQNDSPKMLVNFSNHINTNSLIWDVGNITYSAPQNSYIYIGGNKTQSIPNAYKIGSGGVIDNNINYLLRGNNFVKLERIDNEYAIKIITYGSDIVKHLIYTLIAY